MKNGNAKNYIDEVEKQRLYKKVGKRYVPVSNPFAYSGLENGWWLIKVDGGSTSIARVFPEKAEWEATFRENRDKLIEIIKKITDKESVQEGNKPQLTKEEYDKIREIVPTAFNYFYQYKSYHEMADLILKELMK